MLISEAIEAIEGLNGKWRKGLQALRAQDKPHIEAEDTRRLTGSLDLDLAWRSQDPHSNRWDFAIGYAHSNQTQEWLYWLEIHSATDGQIDVLGKKLEWLKGWLSGPGNLLKTFDSEFFWVSSGTTNFTRTSPQFRRLSMLGLRYAGKILRINNQRV